MTPAVVKCGRCGGDGIGRAFTGDAGPHVCDRCGGSGHEFAHLAACRDDEGRLDCICGYSEMQLRREERGNARD